MGDINVIMVLPNGVVRAADNSLGTAKIDLSRTPEINEITTVYLPNVGCVVKWLNSNTRPTIVITSDANAKNPQLLELENSKKIVEIAVYSGDDPQSLVELFTSCIRKFFNI